MAATEAEKAFYLLEYARTQSIVAVRRSFRIKFRQEPSSNGMKNSSVKRDGFLCIAKRPGRRRRRDWSL
jgi:hypothetical protein